MEDETPAESLARTEADLANTLVELGYTSLMIEAYKEHLDAVKSLLINGADVNVSSSDGETALLLGVRYAYVNEKDAYEIVRLLIEAGANINAQDRRGESAVMRAVYYRYENILKLLIAHGADVNLRRKNGETVISSVEAAPSMLRRCKRLLKIVEDAGGIR